VIVDERFTAAGRCDYYIDILRRPLISYWRCATRGSENANRLDPGSKVMIIDETAGSAAILCVMFRKLKLGFFSDRRKRNVGSCRAFSVPDFIDGGSIRADLAI